MNVSKALVFALFTLPAIMAAQTNQSIFPLLPASVSTVPSNGDVNPYGVAFVPRIPAGGGLQTGDILVSNFNNSQNLQGTGTSILRVDSAGNTSTFFTSSVSQPGLTAALGVLSNGWTLIGNLPTADGTAATVRPGNLSIVDRYGDFLGTIGTLATVDGPWGMAVDDLGNAGTGTAHVFVSNVLSGVISRFDLTYTPSNLQANVVIVANGMNHRLDPAALVLGPSGLVYSASNDTLYVASSADNAIYQIPSATKTPGAITPLAFIQDPTHLHGPLDIAILPDGHYVIANSDGSNLDPNQPSELVEYSTTGQFLAQMPVDPNNGGAFGLAVNNIGFGTIRMGYVDDNANTLTIRTTVVP
jgi:hypothetical protein